MSQCGEQRAWIAQVDACQETCQMTSDSSHTEPSEKLDETLFALSDFANAIEAATISLREHLNELTEVAEWNPDKIAWTPAEDPSGPYERAEDVNNPEFKAMLKDLASHNGKMRRDPHFYWTFQNGHTVGRKKKA